MTTIRGEVLAQGVLQTSPLLKRHLPGFSDANHTKQAPGLPNHVAWNLGHLAHVMHRFAEKLDGRPLPADAFIVGSDRGDPTRYGVESVAFKSVPTDEPVRYPGYARCLAIFDGACERVAAALRAADDRALDTETPWGASTTTIAALAMRMMYHNGTHAGEIIDLRRALGMGRVLE